jgi:hypothetical protein
VPHKAHPKKTATNIYYKQFVMATSHAEGAESEVHPTEFFAKKAQPSLNLFYCFWCLYRFISLDQAKRPCRKNPAGAF